MNTEQNESDYLPEASLSLSVEGEHLKVSYSGLALHIMAIVLSAMERDEVLKEILTSSVEAFHERKKENLQA